MKERDKFVGGLCECFWQDLDAHSLIVLARDLMLFLDIIRREKEKPKTFFFPGVAFERGEYKSPVFPAIITRINLAKSDSDVAINLVLGVDESINEYRRRRFYGS